MRIALLLLLVLWPARAADSNPSLPERDAALLKEVKAPAGFRANIFAAPPQVNYPVFVSAAPDGTLYVSSDKNGSLDRAPHRGSIVRLRDLDGDGRADESKLFVPDVDSPRGLVWDRDRLYLMHPPHLSVFIDHDGDGIADEEKILVKNIAFTFKDRPADHTSNGIELGIDDWLYLAIGDFGFMEAEGADGRKLQFRGGGVLRVRSDGTGLEVFSRGTRNILEVAVSPLLDAFARDNTNDGGGWDTRLHHFTGLEHHGYPSFFKNFSDEIIRPLADYGGGSGCGSLFLDEPGFPPGYNNALYTADWGREWIYRHQLTPAGATLTVNQSEFIHATRVTDIDVDASSRLYISSWKGATFTYVGENVGYILRVSPEGYQAEPVPDFQRASETELIAIFQSPSHRRRLAAQRELLHRGLARNSIALLEQLAANPDKPLPSRVAAIFALKQGLGQRATATLVRLTADTSIRPFALRALTDRLDQLENVPAEPILNALHDSSPRVRREAVFSLARLGKVAHAPALAPLLADSDPVIAHTAVRALSSLGAVEACLAIFDNPQSSTAQWIGALRALQYLHEPAAVDGLITRFQKEPQPDRREKLFTALCRLYFKEGTWKGNSWGTRPDTSGPYYQPEKWTASSEIRPVLKKALLEANGAETGSFLGELNRHKIEIEETLEPILAKAERDPSLRPAIIGQLERSSQIPAQGIPLLSATATADSTSPELRSHAIAALLKVGNDEAVRTTLLGLAQATAREKRSAENDPAVDAFLSFPNLGKHFELLKKEAATLDGTTSVWAEAGLLALSARNQLQPELRLAVAREIDAAWNNPARRTQMLRAIALGHFRSWRDKVLTALSDSTPEVAEAARATAAELRLKNTAGESAAPLIGTLPVETVIASASREHGDPRLGGQLFQRQGCIACHTTRADQPQRGPFLGNIATLYKRPALAEAILLPNKTIAQGFATHHFELKDGTAYDGFVTQEAADKVTIRNVAAQEIEIPVKDIAQRVKLESSMMPEGLAANLTLKEFASLLDYLEALSETSDKSAKH